LKKAKKLRKAEKL